MTRQVAIKCIKQESKYALTGGMELAILAAFSGNDRNDYLLPFIGWYSDLNNLYVVTEYMPNGCLQERLKSVFLNNHEKKHKERLNLNRYVSQIASGMRAMEENKFVHRDLAARNIFLDRNNDIKIGDFGLSRPFESQYSSGLIAVRWMAPEVLANENKFTNKADVWSFGVVVWEIYSFGSLPYSDVPGHKLSALLQEGKRLDTPVDTPSKMATLMEHCWKLKPEERFSFSDIVKYLSGSAISTNQIDQPPPPPPRTESIVEHQQSCSMNSMNPVKGVILMLEEVPRANKCYATANRRETFTIPNTIFIDIPEVDELVLEEKQIPVSAVLPEKEEFRASDSSAEFFSSHIFSPIQENKVTSQIFDEEEEISKLAFEVEKILISAKALEREVFYHYLKKYQLIENR
ncbi:hypothetical protein ACTXT7_005686 [Hymenolepis weldensis]